jgi:DNA primase
MKKSFYCPFHNNTKSPSGWITTVDGVEFFNCFSCGEAGDIISFYSKTFNLSNFDGAKKLLNDYNMGDFIVSEPSDEIKKKKEGKLALFEIQKNWIFLI